LTPACFAARISIRASSVLTCPVDKPRSYFAMTLSTSSASGSSCPLRETATALGEFGTRADASTVGMYTTRPRPPRDNAIASTATGLMPPTALFRTMPPKTSTPGTI
jgi:hypothetical protein